jgi:MoxR-like ATPase
MLEAMEERQVTVEGITHPIPRPFMVMATQNSIEYEGTFPLPEAQLDRFLLMITLGYPTPEQELAIVENQRVAHPIEALKPVTTPEEVIEVQEAVRHVYVDDLVKQYIVAITGSTRSHPDISLGSSPRGSLALFRGGQATAIVRGRDFVLPDDIKELAVAMLSHRIIVSAAARMRGANASDIVAGLVDQVPVPGAQARGWTRK